MNETLEADRPSPQRTTASRRAEDRVGRWDRHASGPAERHGEDDSDDRQAEQDDKDGEEPANGGKDEGRKPKSRLPIIILIAVAVVAIIVGIIYWWRHVFTTQNYEGITHLRGRAPRDQF